MKISSFSPNQTQAQQRSQEMTCNPSTNKELAKKLSDFTHLVINLATAVHNLHEAGGANPLPVAQPPAATGFALADIELLPSPLSKR